MLENGDGWTHSTGPATVFFERVLQLLQGQGVTLKVCLPLPHAYRVTQAQALSLRNHRTYRMRV